MRRTARGLILLEHSFQAIDPRVMDSALIGVIVAGQLGEFFSSSQHPPVWRLAPALCIALALFWRRRFPIAVSVVQGAGSALYLAPPLIASLGAAFVGAYSLGVYSRHRVWSLAVPLMGASILAVVGIPQHFFTPPVPAWIAELVPGVGLWLAGNAVRGHSERARRLEREQELAARVAAAEEREHIACEIHDVVAHSVSVMVVQTGAARTLMDGDPAEARAALKRVEASGREALAELRRLLGVLGSDVEDAGPQPGLEQLTELVDHMRLAGLTVSLELAGESRRLPPGLELTAYRVVQEALTNSLRHAPGADSKVMVTFDELALRIAVVDTGGRSSNGPLPSGPGRGLLGMRARVEASGGHLETGPQPEGGFQITVTLPLDRP